MKIFEIEYSTFDAIVIILSIITGNLGILACYLLICCLANGRKVTLRNRTLTRVNSQFSYYLYQRSLCEYPSVAYDRYQRVCVKLRHYRGQLERVAS